MLGATIFLAGGEVEALTRSLMANDVKFVLYSFFYIEAFNKAHFIDQMQQEYPDVKWFLDSGAFTYSAQSKTMKRLPTPQKYVEDYFSYLRDYGSKWSRIAEPDLEETDCGVDLAQVREWREQMLTEFPEMPITPVWHGWRGEEEWQEYLDDPRIQHLAIGRCSGPMNIQRRLVMNAIAKGKTVHGFGCTKVSTFLKVVPFTSVDSTSVWMGQKYGILYVFHHNRWIMVHGDRKKEDRRPYWNYLKSIGCDPQKVLDDDVHEVRKANVIAWRNLAERWEQLRLRREDVFTRRATEGFTQPRERAVTVDCGVECGTVRTPRTVLAREESVISRRPLARFGVPIDGSAFGRKKAQPR